MPRVAPHETASATAAHSPGCRPHDLGATLRTSSRGEGPSSRCYAGWATHRGQLVVDHQVDGRDVQAASRHVRGHQHQQLAVAELLQRPLAVRLRDVPVQRLRSSIHQDSQPHALMHHTVHDAVTQRRGSLRVES